MAARLPQLVEEIAEVAGLPAALAIVTAKGGQRVSIPRHPGPEHWLTMAVGPEAAATIADHFATGHGSGIKDLDIPMLNTGSYARQRAERRARLDDAIRNGASSNELAARFEMTRRNAIRAKVRLRTEPNTNQGDLFRK